jgi:outer membrane protein TolC
MRIVTYFIMLTLFSPMHVLLGQISLESCQSMARENYPLIRQYELIEKSKGYTLSNANKMYLPQLDVTIIGGAISGLPSFSPAGTESSSSVDLNVISILQINQTIWDGGITKAKKEVIEANSEMEKARLAVSLYALQDRVNNLYFAVLLIDEQIEQLEILTTTLFRNKKRIEIAVENGTAYKSDIDEIQVEIINTAQKSDELRANRKAYIHVLSAMVGEPISESTKLIKPEVDDDLLVLENQRPELELFQQQENLIAAQSKIDKSMLYPKIGLLGFGTFIQPGVDFGPSKLNNIFVGGLSLNWSIGGLYTHGNNKNITDMKHGEVQTQRETFLFNNNLELTQTQIELQKYKALLDQDREILKLKSSIKNAYEVKYENGISTMSELLDKTNEESLAKQHLIVHEIQYLMKAYQYLNKSGN